MSVYSCSTSTRSSQPLLYQPSYTFDDLEDFWNLQKAMLLKYKSTHTPFVILDHENKGFLSSLDFPKRLVNQGFPDKTLLYMKFFSFIDTDCDGKITIEDWNKAFDNIGAYLIEARSLALDHLKKVRSQAQLHGRSQSSLDSSRAGSFRNSQSQANLLQSPWDTPTSMISYQSLSTPKMDNLADINCLERYQSLKDQKLGPIHLDIQNQIYSPHLISDLDKSSKKSDQGLSINIPGSTSSVLFPKEHQRLDEILKRIDNPKANQVTTNMNHKLDEIKQSTNVAQKDLTNYKKEVALENKSPKEADKRIEDLHQRVNEKSAETIGIIQKLFGQNKEINQNIKTNTPIVKEKDKYPPSITSIGGTEEDELHVPKAKIEQKNEAKQTLGGLENILRAKLKKSGTSDLESLGRTNTISRSNSELKTAFSAKERQSGASSNASRSSLISGSGISLIEVNTALGEHNEDQINKNNMGTPSWKYFSKTFSEVSKEDEDVLEIIEKVLEAHGGREEALTSLRKEDLDKFPHLKTLITMLDQKNVEQSGFEQEDRGRRQIQLRKRSRTKSMIELKVRGDLVTELQKANNKRRAITPDSGLKFIQTNLRNRSNLYNTERIIKHGKDIGGIDKAIEILEDKGMQKQKKLVQEQKKDTLKKEAGLFSKIKDRLVMGQKETKTGEDVKKTCRQILETLGKDKSAVLNKKDGIWNSREYMIKDDELAGAKKSFLREQARKEKDNSEKEDKSRLNKVIRQLSQETIHLEISKSKLELECQKRSFLEAKEKVQRAGNIFRENEDKKESCQEKRRVKSFLRGSVVSRNSESNRRLSIDKYSVQDQLQEKLGKAKVLNKYSQMVSDLGSFSLYVEKPSCQQSVTPISAIRSCKNSHLNVKSLLKEELAGRGRTCVLSEYTRLDTVNKDLGKSNCFLKKALEK